MKKALIVIIVLFQSLTYSQEIIELYIDYIPHSMIKNAESKEGVNNTLFELSETHPDLIYYYLSYITHLDKIAEDTSTNLDPNYFNMFKYKKDQFLNKRRLWAFHQTKKIEEHTENKLKLNAMQNVYKPYVDYSSNRVMNTAILKTDENVLEFYNYIYFTQRASAYDSTTNYYALNQDELTPKIDLFTNDYNNFNNLGFGEKTEKIEKNLKLWYLIGKDKPNKYKRNTAFQTYELSIKIYDKLFLTENALIPGLSMNIANFSYMSAEATIDYIFKPLPTYIYPLEYKFTFGLSYKPKMNIELAYQFAIKPELEIFSHIKVNLGYTFVTFIDDDENKGEVFYEFTYFYHTYTDRSKYIYKVNGSQNIKSNFAFIEVSTPIYYFSKSFHIEVGLNTSLKQLQFEYQIVKQTVRDTDDGRTIEYREFTTEPYEDNGISFSPVVSFNYNFYGNANFSLNSSYMYNVLVVASKISYSF